MDRLLNEIELLLWDVDTYCPQEVQEMQHKIQQILDGNKSTENESDSKRMTGGLEDWNDE